MLKYLLALVVALILGFSGCGYNTFQSTDKQIKASWSEVLNQYQRRADLVPNLINTVSGYAKHEQETLLAVTHARSKATAINATPELVNDPQAFAKFEAAQRELSGALILCQQPDGHGVPLPRQANFSVADEKTIAVPPAVGFGRTDKKTESSK